MNVCVGGIGCNFIPFVEFPQRLPKTSQCFPEVSHLTGNNEGMKGSRNHEWMTASHDKHVLCIYHAAAAFCIFNVPCKKRHRQPQLTLRLFSLDLCVLHLITGGLLRPFWPDWSLCIIFAFFMLRFKCVLMQHCWLSSLLAQV